MLRKTSRVRHVRAEFKPHALSLLDQRSREYRLLRRFREELVAHVGGKPSVVETALIERAAQLQLRLAIFDAKFVEKGEMTDHDARTYLAWSNSLTRTLGELGLEASTRSLSPAEALRAARALMSAPSTGEEG